MKKIFAVLLSIGFVYVSALSQSGSVGIGTTNPNASAALDVSSTNKGMLLPRVSSTQRITINAPATGLIVFDTDKKLLYFYNGLQWVPLVPGDPAQTTQQSQTPDDSQIADYMGAAVAISGDYAIAGAPNDDDVASNAGSAYIYFRENGQWVQQAKLTASDGAANDNFGTAVDISGDYAVVGAPHNDGAAVEHGAVYVFRRNGASWGQVNKIVSQGPSPNVHFGTAVTIDGDYMAIGVPDFTSVGGQIFSQCGKVEIYQRNGAAWNVVSIPVPVLQEDARAGTSLSMQGNFLIVGVPYEDVDGRENAGAAYIYARIINSWGLDRRLTITGPQLQQGNIFGSSVDINNNAAIVGTPRINASGTFFMFRRVLQNGSFVWNQELAIVSLELGISDLGTSVALSGDYAVIGDHWLHVGVNPRQGASFIFKRYPNGAWYHFKTLTANPAYPNDEMGTSVGIHNNVVITGIPVSISLGAQKSRILFTDVE